MELLNYKKGSTYLRKKYKLAWFAIGNLNLRTVCKIKDDLVKNHDKIQLRTIKVSINSQVESYKQANLIIPLLLFVLTVTFTLATTFTNLAFKSIDWYPKNEKNYVQVMQQYNKAIQDAFDSNSHALLIVCVFLTIILCIYFLRYSWMTTLNNIVNEALEEKDEWDKEEKISLITNDRE